MDWYGKGFCNPRVCRSSSTQRPVVCEPWMACPSGSGWDRTFSIRSSSKPWELIGNEVTNASCAFSWFHCSFWWDDCIKKWRGWVFELQRLLNWQDRKITTLVDFQTLHMCVLTCIYIYLYTHTDTYIFKNLDMKTTVDFPGGASGKETICRCRRCNRHGFHS